MPTQFGLTLAGLLDRTRTQPTKIHDVDSERGLMTDTTEESGTPPQNAVRLRDACTDRAARDARLLRSALMALPVYQKASCRFELRNLWHVRRIR